MIPNAREDIENFPLMGRSIANAIRREDRQGKRFRKRDGLLIDRFFFAVVMSLKFDVDVLAAEDIDEPRKCRGPIFIWNRFRQRTAFAAGETDESSRIGVQFVFGN